MSDFDRVLGAAGEVSKSQLPDGSYKSTQKMTPHERAELANEIRWRHPKGGFPWPEISRRGNRSKRGLADTHFGSGIAPELDIAAYSHTRPSQVHRNVHYGTSIRPGMEKVLDASLDPKLTGGLRHGVAFHHLKMEHDIAAAASSTHHKALAGGRAHVVINATHLDADGKGVTNRFVQVVNHELVHASTHHQNPQRLMGPGRKLNAKASMGEEARADALSTKGPGLYRRGGVVNGTLTTHAVSRIGEALHHAGVKFSGGTTAEDFREAAQANAHYNRVHSKIRYKTSGVGGLVDDAAKLVAHHPGRYVVGAAATGAVVNHERKKHHMNSADAAVAKARDYEESKHSRGHDGRFTPMNSSGMPQHVPVVDRDGKETGWRYTRVASDKKAFNRVYGTRSNVLSGYNAYIGGVYGAATGAVGGLAAEQKVAPKLHGELASAGALAGGIAGGIGAYKGTKAFMARSAHKDKIQSKFDRKDFYARERVGKAATRNPTPPGNTAGAAVAGGYLGLIGGGLTAGAGKNPERLSDLRAAYHNHAHARAVKQMASYKTKETAPVKRTMRGKYGTYEDLSPRAQKVVRTAHKLKQVAATDKEFQQAMPGAGALAGATVGAAAIGGLAHHNRTKWKAAHPGYRR